LLRATVAGGVALDGSTLRAASTDDAPVNASQPGTQSDGRDRGPPALDASIPRVVADEASRPRGGVVDGGAFAASVDEAQPGNASHLGPQTDGANSAAPAAHADATQGLLHDEALLASDLSVARLTMTRMKVRGDLVLSGSRIGDLCVDDKPAARGLPGPLVATDWQVTSINGVIRTNRRAAAKWLDDGRQARSGPAGFTPQPWHALAEAYERNGQSSEARWLRFCAAHRSAHASWPLSRPFRYAYGALVGYGYYPLAVAGWLLGALICACVLVAAQPSALVAADPAAATRALVQTRHRARAAGAKAPSGGRCGATGPPRDGWDELRAPGEPLPVPEPRPVRA
jgi:hypothetical protein